MIYHYALHTLQQISWMSSIDYISSLCLSCHPALTDKWDSWSHGTYTGNYKVDPSYTAVHGPAAVRWACVMIVKGVR